MSRILIPTPDIFLTRLLIFPWLSTVNTRVHEIACLLLNDVSVICLGRLGYSLSARTCARLYYIGEGNSPPATIRLSRVTWISFRLVGFVVFGINISEGVITPAKLAVHPLTIIVILCIRVWALWDRSRKIGIFLIIISVIGTAVSGATYVLFSTVNSCTHIPTPDYTRLSLTIAKQLINKSIVCFQSFPDACQLAIPRRLGWYYHQSLSWYIRPVSTHLTFIFTRVSLQPVESHFHDDHN
jgi:hypothetical protein